MALKKGPTLASIKPMKAGVGRPTTNVGKFIVKPVGPTRSKTGYELLNKTPQAIAAAKEHYLKAGVLPPALAPAIPEVKRIAKAKAISKGFVKPRSRQG